MTRLNDGNNHISLLYPRAEAPPPPSLTMIVIPGCRPAMLASQNKCIKSAKVLALRSEGANMCTVVHRGRTTISWVRSMLSESDKDGVVRLEWWPRSKQMSPLAKRKTLGESSKSNIRQVTIARVRKTLGESSKSYIRPGFVGRREFGAIRVFTAILLLANRRCYVVRLVSKGRSNRSGRANH